MARAGLFDHRKFQRLVHTLKEPIPHVAGYLECLWSAAYQQRCDLIGDSLDVELSAKYPGEPGKLTSALVACGFVDHHDGKYFVHNFEKHAPRYVRRSKEMRLLSPSGHQSAPESDKLASDGCQSVPSGDNSAPKGRELEGKGIEGKGREEELPLPSMPKLNPSIAKAVDLAERFWFYQRGGKEDKFKLCDAIEAMIECGFDVPAILAEIERAPTSRDRSERFWKLKDRLEKASKATVPKTGDQAIAERRNRVKALVGATNKGGDP